MIQSLLHLSVTVMLVVSVGLAEASDNGDSNVDTSSTVFQTNQSEILQTLKPPKKQQDSCTTQRHPDRTVDVNDDQLRDLEVELCEEQVKNVKHRDRDSVRK